MEFWLTLALIIGVILILPIIRFVFKRISLIRKLKNACRKANATLICTHPLWFLGGRKGKRCEIHIETETELISVKLFQMLRRSSSLHLTENGEYYCEHCIIALFGRYGGSSHITYKTKPKLMPEYDFSYKRPDTDKPIRKILLVNPICAVFHIHTKENARWQGIADIGDTVKGIELYALKALTEHLTEKY